jgi:hypothetical protein
MIAEIRQTIKENWGLIFSGDEDSKWYFRDEGEHAIGLLNFA